jgi:hypothetical protein
VPRKSVLGPSLVEHTGASDDLPLEGSGVPAAAAALPAAFDVAFSAFLVAGVGAALDGAVLGSADLLPLSAVEDAGACAGFVSDGTGCVDATLGELVALVLRGCCVGGKGTGPVDVAAGCIPGGGGNGVKPRLFLSLAAAAAAADAYFRPSPAGRVGNVAGFMPAEPADPFVTFANGLCNVANVGSGDLSCADGRRPVVAAASTAFRDAFGTLDGRGSGSGISSCTD